MVRVAEDCIQSNCSNLVLSPERLDVLVALWNYVFLGISGSFGLLNLWCGVFASGSFFVQVGHSYPRVDRVCFGQVYSSLDGAKLEILGNPWYSARFYHFPVIGLFSPPWFLT